jgi:hypothetical protein
MVALTGSSAAGAGSGDMAELGLLFAHVAMALNRDDGEGVDPDRLVELAARAIPHAGHCTVTLLRHRRRPQTAAASNPLPVTVDELQYAVGEGPALDAATGDGVVLVDDLAADPRWPRFSALCLERTGVRAMLCVHLALAGSDHAAINFYAEKPGVFAEVDVSVATVLVPLAASSLQAHLYQQEVNQLETALTTSRQIGAAVGIMMAQRGLTYDQAFEQLRRASQHLNVKLRDLAADVQWTGTLPAIQPDNEPPARR